MMRKLWPLMVLVVTSACLSDTSPSPTTTASGVSAVSIAPGSVTIAVGQTAQYTATLTGGTSGTVLTWTVSNPLVASVSTTGLLTAKGTGSATVTATTGGVSGAASVTVLPSGVTITPSTNTLAVGQSLQLRGDVNDGTGAASAVTWAFSDPLVASVSPAGLLTAKGTGVGTVTATAGSMSTTATLTVTPSGIVVTPAITSLVAGQTQVFTGVPNDGSGRTSLVSWSFSNDAVATVSAQTSGLLTTIAPGAGTLTASAGGFSKDIAFTVTAGAVDKVLACDRTIAGTCASNAALTLNGTAVAVRASAYNAFGADISGSCVFAWNPLLPGIVSIQLSTDLARRDALITRVGAGSVSVLVTCGSVVGVFTVN